MLFSGADVTLSEDHLKKYIILSKGGKAPPKKRHAMLLLLLWWILNLPIGKSKGYQQHERKGKLDEIYGIKIPELMPNCNQPKKIPS